MVDAVWTDEKTAERCESTDDHVHLIITTPGGKRIVPHCRKISLRLFFYDLEPDKIRKTKAFEKEPEKGQELIDGCFTKEQAAQIIGFLKLVKGGKLVVNCEVGVSRSPGVVLALRQHFGGNVEEVFEKAYPNMHVARLLTRALHD